MSELLIAENLTKTFDEQFRPLPVVRNISLTARAGEIICILGASGAGKTTLLNLLSGTAQPTSGTVTSPFARPGNKIGTMRQSDDLLPWRTVKGNIALGLELLHYPTKEIDEYCHYWLDKINLAEYRDFYPAQLSGGMKQRVALARCFAPMPKILFLDEPLGSLDIVGRRKMAEHIKHYVREEKAAAIVVTHSVEEAIFLADTIFVMTPRPMTIAAEIILHDDDSHSAQGLHRSKAFDMVASTLFAVSQEPEIAHA